MSAEERKAATTTRLHLATVGGKEVKNRLTTARRVAVADASTMGSQRQKDKVPGPAHQRANKAV